MALWCSRLARQPVTLEVDGSSPFGVAKKEKPSIRMAFLFCYHDKDSKIKYKLPGAVCLPPARWRQLLYFLPTAKMQPSPFGVANKKRHPNGWRFLLAITIRTRKYNAAVRRTVARCGLDRGDSSVSALRKRKRVRSGLLLLHTANQSAPSLPRMVLSNLRIVYLLPLVAAKAPWYNLYQEESA